MQTIIHIKGENMINLIRNIIALGVVALAFTACSTMNKNECINADWKTIGYGDGTNGYKASRISQHRSACAEHAIAPDLNAYNAGRNQGLNQYCIPSRGYYKGLSGSRYNGVCTNHKEAAYLDAFNYGTAVYKEVKILDNLKREHSSEEHRIRKIERSLKHKEHEMINGKLSKLKAYKLLQETKDMSEELGKAKFNLANLSGNIDNQADRIADMKRERRYN